jgi:hypothetical protein
MCDKRKAPYFIHKMDFVYLLIQVRYSVLPPSRARP